MARSLKKGPYVFHKLEKKVLANVETAKAVIKTWSRATMITPDLLVKQSQYTTDDHLYLFM